jgi:hypothetical protein
MIFRTIGVREARFVTRYFKSVDFEAVGSLGSSSSYVVIATIAGLFYGLVGRVVAKIVG